MSNDKITTLSQLKEAISKGEITDVNEIAKIINHSSFLISDYHSIPGNLFSKPMSKAMYLLDEYGPKQKDVTPLSAEDFVESKKDYETQVNFVVPEVVRMVGEYASQQMVALKSQVKELNGTIDVYKQDWKVMNDEIKSLKNQVEELKDLQDKNEKLINFASGQKQELEKEIEQLKSKCERMEKAISYALADNEMFGTLSYDTEEEFKTITNR